MLGKQFRKKMFFFADTLFCHSNGDLSSRYESPPTMKLSAVGHGTLCIFHEAVTSSTYLLLPKKKS